MTIRCLIVDDNDAFLAAARFTLQRQGAEVVGVASTAAEALERVDRFRPEVVLVDVRLGKESGVELARRLQEAGTTTVMISTHLEIDVDELVSASGAAGFVPKSRLSTGAILALLDGTSSGTRT